MKFAITGIDRLKLRQASLYAPERAVRLRAVCLLHLSGGSRIAALGRSCKVSRPTVYKWARVFLASRSVEDLRTDGIGRRYRLALTDRPKAIPKRGRDEEPPI